MFLGLITLAVAILSFFGLIKEMKRKNIFGAGFAFVSFAVFGWFSVRTIIAVIFTDGGGVVAFISTL
ncbi:DUF2759 domain-containing protein [Alkalicoccus daliensis]|uniref:DUF2759 domain-containing protein n=1 Tax=Alkalicoccus daliensis TaxID=745820 RepID=A0A1H0B8A6_9BACI|nr:DUF2759 domain-containing protein [Alkalicoccus daliensis]SDN41583.1 Protein of unknown function [Alkalicoccus daliensis]